MVAPDPPGISTISDPSFSQVIFCCPITSNGKHKTKQNNLDNTFIIIAFYIKTKTALLAEESD